MKKSIIIVGMGPGLSLGIAEKFGSQGYQVAMVSRNADKLTGYQRHLEALGITAIYQVADVADTGELIAALRSIKALFSIIDVLLYNAVDYRIKHVLDEHIDDLTTGFKISVGNVVEAVKELLTQLTASKGSILLTGGASANTPSPEMASISLGKAGIKNLAYQLNPALKNRGIYVGTVTIGGYIQPDSLTHSPKIIAEKFWELNLTRNVTELEY